MLDYETKLINQGFKLIAGVDEVGRGSLAGPIAAASVILDHDKIDDLQDVKDSKLLTPEKRDQLYDLIISCSICHHVTMLSNEFIDVNGLTIANKTVLREAVNGLKVKPDYILCDAFAVDGMSAPALSLIKGDKVSISIAAASIVAKVTRDRFMIKLHEKHPEYKFNENKGYSSDAHWEALRIHGPSTVHRISYAGVAQPNLF